MHLSSRLILAILYTLTCTVAVSTMRYAPTPGWRTIWPRDFEDKRLHFRDSATVYAWPSNGGRLELQNPSAFELSFLGIPDLLMESDKCDNPTDEDAFVQRLRRLGGTFYECEHQYDVKVHENLLAEVRTWLGWPGPEDAEHEGGVWVLKLAKSETYARKTGRISLATTMQQRCRAIEICGGVFYADPTEEHLVPIASTNNQMSGVGAADMVPRRYKTLDLQHQEI